MVAFADLFQLPTREQIKAGVIAIAEAARLAVTTWVFGDPSERWIEINARAVDQFLSNITTQTVRMFFLELATDPGDAGDLSADQTPRPGWLSALGSGWFGVQRGGETFAVGFATVTNAGSTNATFSPFDLTFQRSTVAADGGAPTYRNTSDPSIYVGVGGTLTLAPSASATIPIICEQPGTYGNASPSQISIAVTQSFGTLTVTNASPVLGTDREAREDYIERCRQASAAASPGGPRDAYRYASTTGADGNPLQLYDGSGTTTVNRVYVSADSSEATVTIFLANPSGPATAAEVSSANGNINGIAIPHPDTGVVHNANPIGVVPDTVTLLPTTEDPITMAPGPAAAIATPIGPLKGAAKIKGVPGRATTALIKAAQLAIATGLSTYFQNLEIGGLDQEAGAGVVYTEDLEDEIRQSYAGLYNVELSAPAVANTDILEGHVATLVGPPSISAAANNGSGLVRLTVSSTSGITTGNQIQIYEAVTSGGLSLLGTWTVTVIDIDSLDLQSSTWTGSFTSASMSLIRILVT